MNYYQARIAIDTAQLLEELKSIYEKKSGVTITKGNTVMKAYEDSQWVSDWSKIHGKAITLKNQYDISPNALKLRIQISKEVEQGIKELQSTLKEVTKARSITIGVCLRDIFKAAYLKNTQKEISQNINSNNRIFEKYKNEATSLFKDDTLEEILGLLDRLHSDLNSNI